MLPQNKTGVILTFKKFNPVQDGLPMILTVFFGLFLIIFSISFYLASKIVFPKTIPVEKTYEIEIEKGKINETEYQSWDKQEIKIASPFGYNIAALYFPAENSHKTVIISHGIAHTRYGSVKYVPLFRQHGFNILIYDLRYHGQSGGKNCTFGYFEKKDLVAMTDWAFKQTGENGIVGTMGESMGAAISIQHAAIDPRLSFVISDCSFSDLESQINYRLKKEFPAMPLIFVRLASLLSRIMTGMTFSDIQPKQDISKFSTPAFIIHSFRDTYIPYTMSEILYRNKTNGYRKVWVAPQGNHAGAFWHNKERYARELQSFLEDIGVNGTGKCL